MKRFDAKVVLVTGGSRGLGAAIAKRFADEGADVGILFHEHGREAEEVAAYVKKSGGKCVSLRCDVSDELAVRSAIEQAVGDLGKLDVMVNNAGIVFDVPFSKKTTEQWKRTLDVNLNGVYFCSKYAIPHLSKGGSIINISSTNGIDTFHPDSLDYDVSKAGVIMFTKGLARELAPGIRVNSIAPGWFDTDMNAELSKTYIKEEEAKIALERFGKPEEVASVAAFLASEDASFMTGATVVVDGGYGGAL
jgi:3-oxoacyl-[acyl-carrier protein] reductase